MHKTSSACEKYAEALRRISLAGFSSRTSRSSGFKPKRKEVKQPGASLGPQIGMIPLACESPSGGARIKILQFVYDRSISKETPHVRNLRMNYYTIGRTGLKVSQLALGTMTFGTEWGWGAEERGARELYSMAREHGINFFDTANIYTGGTSEEWLGRFVNESGDRDKTVIATKYSLNTDGDPNTGGNSRKNMIASVEASLKRMDTDYIDLFYLHVWDHMTPADEVMRAFDDLTSAGKIRYAGLSDVPAWYASRAATLAELRGWQNIAAIQLQYSLIERNLEYEFTDLCSELGAGLVAWGPLGGGLLSGKYKPSSGRQPDDAGRLATVQDVGAPVFQKFTDRNWKIIEALEAVAKELGEDMATVALNWVVNRPSISSILLGASKPEQLRSNLRALAIEIPNDLKLRLDEVSALEERFPYSFFGPSVQEMVSGGKTVGQKPPHYQKEILFAATGKPAW